MMNYVYSILVSVVAAMLTFILQSMIKENHKLKEEKEKAETNKEKAIMNGLSCLLRNELIQMHKTHMAAKYVSLRDYEVWMEMCDVYFALGGNGVVKHLREDIEQLKMNSM